MKPGCQGLLCSSGAQPVCMEGLHSLQSLFPLYVAQVEEKINTADTKQKNLSVLIVNNTSNLLTEQLHFHFNFKPKKRRTTVLFGTSMTRFVLTKKKLGYGGRKVINI
jgi:hypothetical protein